MPTEFLTDDQEQAYGHYLGPPSAQQLSRYFHLDDADRERIDERRGADNKLGFAVQLTTVRFLGTFLAEPTDVPSEVVAYVATQLGIRDAACLADYAARPATAWEHAAEIRRIYAYRDFTDPAEGFRLVRWLYTRAWLSSEQPSVLFDLATARLVERQVLLPGVTILARLVARIRERANARLYRKLARMPSATQRDQLKELLAVPAGARRSALDRLRRGPTQPTAAGLVEALRRLNDARALGVGDLDLSGIPTGRLRVLARYASSARAQVFQRMPAERGIATLLAFACTLQATAQDDVLDVLDVLLTDLLARVESQEQRRRLRTIGDLDAAALLLRNVGLVVLHSNKSEHNLRSEIFSQFSREQVEAAVATVGELARPPQNKQAPEALLSRYSSVRQFLPMLLETITPHAADGGRAVLAAWEFLHRIERMATPPMQDAPLRIVTPAWRRLVVRADKTIDRRAYTFCVLQALLAAFKRHDLYVTPSQRWGDPRAQLLTGDAWQVQRASVCRTLGRDELPQPELERLKQELDAAYRRTADNLPTNEAVHIERARGRQELVLSGLDKLDEPPSLVALKTLVAQRMPRVELPELLLEVQAWTGFASDFTHVNEHGARADDLPISVCAALLAEACNVGLEPLVRPEIPALTRARLAWIQQSYIRADTITTANNHLVDVHTALPLTKALGGGELASADGIRFVVPVRSVHAGANPKYFGRGKGVTYLNYTSAGSIGFFGFVVPGTLRDSMFILDGLLEQHTALKPTTLVTDSASYSDIVFALFMLLGYRFSPRLADLGETRFYRISSSVNYGPLNSIARHRINTDLITRNWDDLLRVAGSLKLGYVSAHDLMRTFQGSGRNSSLARALGEYGRIGKTLHLLDLADDELYRRSLLIQVNKGERRHGLARTVFHGHGGQLRQAYREGQEDQLGALGLVLNAIVLWNTRYMGLALDELRAAGMRIQPEDIERLSPLIHHHIHLDGRYSFSLPESVAHGELRALRDPNDPAEQVFDLVAATA
jgi:TnpA family transposase